MKLSINFRNLRGDSEIIHYIDHRLSFAFSRMEHEIEDMTVTLTDINGPKAGVDKQCRVVVKPVGLSRIVITEKCDQIKRAIDRSLSRASQSLGRKLKRRRMLFKRSPAQLIEQGTMEKEAMY